MSLRATDYTAVSGSEKDLLEVDHGFQHMEPSNADDADDIACETIHGYHHSSANHPPSMPSTKRGLQWSSIAACRFFGLSALIAIVVLSYCRPSLKGELSPTVEPNYLPPRLFTAMIMFRTTNIPFVRGEAGSFDAAHPPDEDKFHQLVQGYYANVCELGLASTIFTDAPANWTVRYHLQPFIHPLTSEQYVCDVLIEPITVHTDNNISPNDMRFLQFQMYLSAHRHRYTVFSDISDVRFDSDPFVFIRRQEERTQLFVGQDDNRLDFWWFVDRFNACHISMPANSDITALNVGVIGGTYEASLWLLGAMTAAIRSISATEDVNCMKLALDMITLNLILADGTANSTVLTPRPLPYAWMTGRPFVGPFRDISRYGEQYIRHKTTLSAICGTK